MMKAVKVQFSSVRIGLWCHLRCSIVSWLGSNSQSRKLQIPHRLNFFGSMWISSCVKCLKTDVQRAESSMKFCLECWIHYTETMWLKTVNKQTRKHVEKGFTLNFWRLVDSSVILEIYQVRHVLFWLLEQGNIMHAVPHELKPYKLTSVSYTSRKQSSVPWFTSLNYGYGDEESKTSSWCSSVVKREGGR